MHRFEYRQVGIQIGLHGRDRAARQMRLVLVAEDDISVAVVVFGGGSGLRPFEPGECDEV